MSFKYSPWSEVNPNDWTPRRWDFASKLAEPGGHVRARHRTYSMEFKRLVAQQHLSGEFALAALAGQHDMCRSLIRVWVAKYEAGEFDDESVQGDIL